jgi:acyl carrier protein
MNLFMCLEQTFGIDFSDGEFDVTLVDSVSEIVFLIDSQASK